MIPGWLISAITFPGVILHEAAHELFCKITNTKVIDIQYYKFSVEKNEPAGYVIHEKSSNYFKTFLITLGPLFINTLLAFMMGIIAVSKGTGPFALLFGWLTFCFGMHAIPSLHDSWNLLKESSEAIMKFNIFALVGIIISPILSLASLFQIVWFDAIYAFGILYMAKELIITGFILKIPKIVMVIVPIVVMYGILFPVLKQKKETHTKAIIAAIVSIIVLSISILI